MSMCQNESSLPIPAALLLRVFDRRYRVYELATGAKLVDRAGHSPNFSPTSRFLVADIGDADGRDLEVIDLVSQQVIHVAAGPFVAGPAATRF